jgi:hypothetical protein
MNRREILKTGAAASAALLIPSASLSANAAPQRAISMLQCPLVLLRR